MYDRLALIRITMTPLRLYVDVVVVLVSVANRRVVVQIRVLVRRRC